MNITQTKLLEFLHYDPITGLFRWRKSLGSKRLGSIAGSVDAGYIRVRIFGKHYRAHRLAVMYVTGAWPPNEVDHKDRNPTNNAWKNLRLATNSQNHANTVSKRVPKSMSRGIDWSPRHKKWRARITFQGRLLNLGYFVEIDEANQAYKTAAIKHFGEFARV